jgi:predicted PurR-regulated permease PerM
MSVATRSSANPITWSVILALTCLLLFAFQKILWLVVPGLLGVVLHYLLSPFSKRLIMAGISTGLAAALPSGALLLLVGGWLLLLYPIAVANATEWQALFLRYLEGGATALQAVVAALQREFSFLRNSSMGEELQRNLWALSTNHAERHFGRFALTLAAWLPSLLLAPLIAYFLLKDGARLRKLVGSAVPNAYFEKTLYLMHALDHTARLYFLGVLKLIVIDATLLSAGLWVLGLPHPILLGTVAALLGVIPYLGPLLGCALALMIAATDSPGELSLIYWIIGLFALVRLLEDFLFMPLIIGKSLHIHPLVAILMFIVGEAIAGIAGLMLVIPILGVVMVLGETLETVWRDCRLHARHAHAKRLRWRRATADL